MFSVTTGGLSRGGKLLPNVSGGPRNDYAGHVFWDMDTWIMPPIMMFYPDMARMMIGSRIRVLPVVRERARANGFQGAQFPWEQAFTGRELDAVPLLARNRHLQVGNLMQCPYGVFCRE